LHKEQLQALKDWFAKYVIKFHNDVPEARTGIQLKEDHTWRVCDNILRIGRSLNLNPQDLNLAESIALLHDIGRFKQFSLYRTFNDRESANHAHLGLQEIEANEVLSGLDGAERHIILKAVEYHNLRDLPAMPPRQMLFARMIRDADKLDILKVYTEHYDQENNELAPVLGAGLPETQAYSPIFIENLLENQKCLYSDIKNSNDRKLLQLSCIYDINFPYTMAAIKKKGYIEKTINFLPGTEDILKIHRHLQSYVTQFLDGKH